MSRRATVRTTHADPATVAAAIAPDNTDEMTTTVEEETVVTRIDRGTTGGLHSTVDDYVVNLEVAQTVVQQTTNTTDAGNETADTCASASQTRDRSSAEASTTTDTNNE